MKKIKKLLCLISSAVVCAAGTMSASAVFYYGGYGPLNYENAVFSSKIVPDNTNYSCYEYFIDDNYNAGMIKYYNGSTLAVVRMTSDSEPVFDKETMSEEITKLDKSQLIQAKDDIYSAYFPDDVKKTDSFYMIIFKNDEYAEKYCTEVLEEDKSDSAITYRSWSCGGCSLMPDHLNHYGIYDLGLNDDIGGFSVTFKDSVSAESLDTSAIEGFEENVSASVVKDNVLYFQFREYHGKTFSEDTVKVLNALQKSDMVENVFPYSYGTEENVTSSPDLLPPSYELGDITKNGRVDLYDAISVAEYMAKICEYDELQSYLADVDEDEDIDLYDAIEIAKKLV